MNSFETATTVDYVCVLLSCCHAVHALPQTLMAIPSLAALATAACAALVEVKPKFQSPRKCGLLCISPVVWKVTCKTLSTHGSLSRACNSYTIWHVLVTTGVLVSSTVADVLTPTKLFPPHFSLSNYTKYCTFINTTGFHRQKKHKIAFPFFFFLTTSTTCRTPGCLCCP